MKYLYLNGKFTLAIFLVFFITPIVSIGYLPKEGILENIPREFYALDMQRNIFIDDAVVDFPQLVSKDKIVFQLVTHGRPGQLLINGSWLSAPQIATFIKEKIGKHSDVLFINIYGCNFAKGRKGKEAVLFLEKNLKVHVAASSNITGRGGDWTLEVGIPKNVLHPSYSHSLQSNCYTAGTNQGKIYINYYCLGPTPVVSESTSFDVAPNFPGVNASSGYPTNSNAPTPPHSGAIETGNNAGFSGYTSSTTSELYVIDIFISKKAMDCALGFTTGYYEFRMKVTGFSRQVLFVDTTGSNSSITGDWKSKQVLAGPGANPLYSDTISIQVSNPTDWIFTKNYTVDATLASLYAIEYRHSSQSTFSTVPSAWVYPAIINNDICLKDSFPSQLASSSGDTLCSGQTTTLSGNCTMSGTTLNWYSDAALTAALPSTTISPIATATYYAACEAGGCKSNASTITVAVKNAPSAPTSGGDKSYCTGSSIPALTATVAANQTVDWYGSSSTGPVQLSNNTSYTPTASGTYYAEARDIAAGCVSVTRTPITLTALTSPSAPSLSDDTAKNVCPATIVNLTALTIAASGISYEWHTNNNTLSTSLLSSPGSANAGSYYVFAKSTNSCFSPSSHAVAIVNTCPTNDTISMQPSCNTCEVTGCAIYDDLPSTGNKTFSSCSTPTGYTASAMTPSGCITYTQQPLAPDSAKSCIVAFDVASGLYDTTIVILRKTTVLPLSIISFSGESMGSNNILTWKVAKTENLKSFTILKSEDQTNWRNVGVLVAKNRETLQTLSLTDFNPNIETYYRLQATEQDGEITDYPKILRIKRNAFTEDQVKLYPNPTANIVYLEYINSHKKTTLKIALQDITGRVINAFDKTLVAGKNTISIETGVLINGTYIIQYMNIENKKSGKLKFVKQSQ